MSDTPPATTQADAAQANQVRGWIASGETEHNIIEAIRANFPGVEVSALLNLAMAQIGKQAEADPASIMTWSLEATREIYRKQMEAGQYADAVKTIKYINELAADIHAARELTEDVHGDEGKT